MKKNGCPKGTFKIDNYCTNVGYSSHGKWSTFGEIRELELERGNQFPKNTLFPDDTPAIWIALEKRRAARYDLPAETWDKFEWDDVIDAKELNSDFEIAMMFVKQISLDKDDHIITDDGDGGYLLVRPKKTQMGAGSK